MATDCIDMGDTVYILGFPYLHLPGEKRCTQVLGKHWSFVNLMLPKGEGKKMHINPTFLLFMNDGKAWLECWTVA